MDEVKLYREYEIKVITVITLHHSQILGRFK